jgi:hypothetical protein
VLVCSYVCRWSVFHCGYASIVFCGCCWLCSNYVCADLNFLGTGGVRLCCVEPVTGYMVFCNALGPGSFGPETLKKKISGRQRQLPGIPSLSLSPSPPRAKLPSTRATSSLNVDYRRTEEDSTIGEEGSVLTFRRSWTRSANSTFWSRVLAG